MNRILTPLDSTGFSPGQTLSTFEKIGTSLIVLAFALLPIGRTVEYPTVIMAVWGLFLLHKQGWRQVWQRADMRAFLLFFALYWLPMVTSLFDAYDLANAGGVCFKYLRFFFAGYFVLYVLSSAKLKRWVLWGLTFAVNFWLIFSLLQWATDAELFAPTYIDGRLLGPFKKLIMPIFLSMLLPLVLVYSKLTWPRYLFWAQLILAIWIMLLAGSRASLVVLLYGWLLYILYSFTRSGKRPIIPMLLLVVGLLGVGAAGYQFESGFKARVDRTMLVFSSDYDSLNEASSLRLPIWQTAYRMALANPWNGVGVRGFRYRYLDYAAPDEQLRGKAASHPHFFVMEILTETGVIGLAAMLCAMAWLYRLGFKHFKTWTPLQAGSWVTLAIAFFPLNIHTSLYGSVYSQVAWLMAAIAIAWLYDQDGKAESGSD